MKINRRALIMTDHHVDEIFIKTIENRLSVKVDFVKFKIRLTRIPVLDYHITCFLQALRAAINKNKYCYIIFFPCFSGLYYSIFEKLSFKKHGPIYMVESFIFRVKNGFRGLITRLLFKGLLRCSGPKMLLVLHSRKEEKYYLQILGECVEGRLFYVALGDKMPAYGLTTGKEAKSEPYFFSGGWATRDYETLFLAIERTKYNLKVACRRSNTRNLKIPSRAEVFYNAHGQDFINLLRDAYAVVLLLNDANVSSGQLVLLAAMRLEKPIIATYCAGFEDYIDKDCALFVKQFSSESVVEAMNYAINNREKMAILAKNAREKYEINFTIEKYAQRIADILLAKGADLKG